MAMSAYDTHADLFNRLFQGTMRSVVSLVAISRGHFLAFTSWVTSYKHYSNYDLISETGPGNRPTKCDQGFSREGKVSWSKRGGAILGCWNAVVGSIRSSIRLVHTVTQFGC